jgi:hypothetical protein
VGQGAVLLQAWLRSREEVEAVKKRLEVLVPVASLEVEAARPVQAVVPLVQEVALKAAEAERLAEAKP